MAERDWGQKDLAAALEIKPPSVSQLLSGETNPRLETIEAVAGALEVPAARLLEEERSSNIPVRIRELLEKLPHNSPYWSAIEVVLQGLAGAPAPRQFLRAAEPMASFIPPAFLKALEENPLSRAEWDRLQKALEVIQRREELSPSAPASGPRKRGPR